MRKTSKNNIKPHTSVVKTPNNTTMCHSRHLGVSQQPGTLVLTPKQLIVPHVSPPMASMDFHGARMVPNNWLAYTSCFPQTLMGVSSSSCGYPNNWLVKNSVNLNSTWMMTGGTPKWRIGNLHMIMWWKHMLKHKNKTIPPVITGCL